MELAWLAIVMFALFLVLLLAGYPVAFSFAGTAIVFGAVGVAAGVVDFSAARVLFSRWFGSMSDPILLAIPFFVFMGSIFEKSGLAERLLTTIGLLMGPMRGGLALTVVVVGALLAAATGVVAATVIVMGMISQPTMVRYGYDHRVASGAIVAPGTLAQPLPPSLVLIVLASVAGVGVGDLFVGALLPGVLLTMIHAAYVLYVGWRHPAKVPALPVEDRELAGAALLREALVAVVPPLLLIFAVLGSIFFGVVFPTEAGAVGAVGACLLAAANRNLSWRMVREAGQTTTNITALVLMILFASTFFALVFDQLGGQRLATQWLTGLPGGFWGFLIVANIAVSTAARCRSWASSCSASSWCCCSRRPSPGSSGCRRRPDGRRATNGSSCTATSPPARSNRHRPIEPGTPMGQQPTLEANDDEAIRYMRDKLGPGWGVPMAGQHRNLAQLGDFLRAEQTAGRRFLPAASRILAAFQQPFDDVRVLLVGQDPYPTPGHPIGLCFSVAPDVRPVPKSLANIYAEYQTDLGLPAPSNGDLTPWTMQGVMLLNRVLTVRAGAPASHRGKGWEAFTEQAIRALVARRRPLVAILWGRDARSLRPLLGDTPIVESAHPSPLSAARGFFGSRPFSRTNALLEQRAGAPIDWRLP